jgi:hypothetical protein
MADEKQTRPGRCPTHGNVQAERPMPNLKFPFVVYAVRRALARRGAYRCPECGEQAS